MIGVFYGLAAAFCWGSSDFFAAAVSRRMGALRALLGTQSCGLVALALLLSFRGTATQATPKVLWLLLGIGLMQAIAVYLFYRAFELGKLSLVAPITSGFAVVTAILALLSGERPGPLALVGALLLIIGVLFITSQQKSQEETESERKATLRGIPEAILAALIYGVIFWALDFVVPAVGPVWPLVAMRVVTLACLGTAFFFIRKSHPAPPVEKPRSLIVPVLAVSIAETLAWLAFNTGTLHGDVAIVTALSSLYSAIAIFYGCVLWRERLQRAQWLGVGLILMGVLLVGVK